MKTVDLIQGSQLWHAHRAQFFNASDAPAMMGFSPYKTRSQLLQERATGITPEVDAGTQRRFDDGHRFEALARPLAEQIIGDDLYPVTGTNGNLSASFDGLTLMNDTAFEHKSLNEALRYDWDEGNGYHLPKHYQVQMEHQLMVSGAERVLFMATRWQGEECIERRHCWYASDPQLRAQIVAGWAQFAEDLKAYVPSARAEVVVAEPVQSLPSVSVVVSGEISIKDNFKAFEVAVRDFLDHRLIRAPKTDQDFATLDHQIKAMKGAEAALDAAEGQMLAQIQTVDQAKKTKDMLAKLVRDNRLMAEKLLSSEKERRRGEIVAVGVTGLREHISALNARLGKPYMPAVQADFGGVIKGKKNLASMEDAVSTELARAKIEASGIADRIQANLKAFDALDADPMLFADHAQLVLKAPDDFQAVVTSRIAAHKAKEQARLDAERERIRTEESAKLKREQDAEAARLAAEAVNAAQAPAPVALPAEPDTPAQGSQPVLKAEAATPDATDRDTPVTTSPGVGSMGAGQPADAGPAGAVDARADSYLPASVHADAYLLADCLAFVRHAESAFTGTKFPTQPKPGVEWWATLKGGCDVLARRLVEAGAQP